MSFKFTFSGDIYRARKQLNMTQQQVAEATSISRREYQNIEGGKVVPRIETFLKLVYFFDLDIHEYRKVFDIDDTVSAD